MRIKNPQKEKNGESGDVQSDQSGKSVLCIMKKMKIRLVRSQLIPIALYKVETQMIKKENGT